VGGNGERERGREGWMEREREEGGMKEWRRVQSREEEKKREMVKERRRCGGGGGATAAGQWHDIVTQDIVSDFWGIVI